MGRQRGSVSEDESAELLNDLRSSVRTMGLTAALRTPPPRWSEVQRTSAGLKRAKSSFLPISGQVGTEGWNSARDEYIKKYTMPAQK